MKKMMVAVLVLTTSHFPISWAVDSFWEDTAGAASKKSNAGIELIRTGDLEGARRLFKQAVALDPENAGFWANLGMVQVDLGEEVAALKSFRRGLGVDPNNKLILKNIKELESSSTSSAAVGASGNVEIIDLSNKDNAGVDLVTSLTDDAIDVRELLYLCTATNLPQTSNTPRFSSAMSCRVRSLRRETYNKPLSSSRRHAMLGQTMDALGKTSVLHICGRRRIISLEFCHWLRREQLRNGTTPKLLSLCVHLPLKSTYTRL